MTELKRKRGRPRKTKPIPIESPDEILKLAADLILCCGKTLGYTAVDELKKDLLLLNPGQLDYMIDVTIDLLLSSELTPLNKDILSVLSSAKYQLQDAQQQLITNWINASS